ncbi:MAG: RidA family protein [Bacteroidota bacterium]
MKTALQTDQAPPAIGPYSQAVRHGNLIFVSGQLGLGPDGSFAGQDAATQARKALENIGAILGAAGLGFEAVVKCTIFLTDMGDFQAVNEVYREFFTPPYPARACVQAAALPKGGLVEIEAIAAG